MRRRAGGYVLREEPVQHARVLAQSQLGALPALIAEPAARPLQDALQQWSEQLRSVERMLEGLMQVCGPPQPFANASTTQLPAHPVDCGSFMNPSLPPGFS